MKDMFEYMFTGSKMKYFDNAMYLSHTKGNFNILKGVKNE